jgi:hypothetical protein
LGTGALFVICVAVLLLVPAVAKLANSRDSSIAAVVGLFGLVLLVLSYGSNRIAEDSYYEAANHRLEETLPVLAIAVLENSHLMSSTFRVKNIGLGPALNVMFYFGPSEIQTPRGSDERIHDGIFAVYCDAGSYRHLEAGYHFDVECQQGNTLQDVLDDAKHHPDFTEGGCSSYGRALVTYQGVQGNEFSTKAEVWWQGLEQDLIVIDRADFQLGHRWKQVRAASSPGTDRFWQLRPFVRPRDPRCDTN